MAAPNKKSNTSNDNSLKNEENYRNLFDNLRDSVWIATIDGIIIDANPATSEMLGYPLQDIIGSSVLNYYQNPSQRFRFKEQVEKYGLVKDYEINMKRITGEIITCLFTATLCKDADGKVMGYQGIVRDITKRKQTEEKQKESEKKYRELVESANSIIAKFDEMGKIISMNEFGLNFFGYKEEELIGKTWIETIVPKCESSGKKLENLANDIIMDLDKYSTNVNENIKKNGERVWVHWTNKPDKG